MTMPEAEPGAGTPRRRGIYLLPNLLTTGGLFAGFFAIISASQGQYTSACIAVFVAALLDGLDGRVARLTNTQSEFGVQYDSLADLVSFGMAPSLVMYHWALSYLAADGPVWAKVAWGAAFLYAACAALRLARFNTQTAVVDKRWFIGLASPAAAALMMSFVWTAEVSGLDGGSMRFAALAVCVVAGLLMVSRVRYFSFKAAPRSERVPFLFMIIAVVVFIALMIDPPRVLFAAALLYALSGPLFGAWGRIRRRRSEG